MTTLKDTTNGEDRQVGRRPRYYTDLVTALVELYGERVIICLLGNEYNLKNLKGIPLEQMGHVEVFVEVESTKHRYWWKKENWVVNNGYYHVYINNYKVEMYRILEGMVKYRKKNWRLFDNIHDNPDLLN